jgi:hypothetical protein
VSIACRRLILHKRVAVWRARGLVRGQLVVLLERMQLGVFVERLQLLGLRRGIVRFRLNRRPGWCHLLARHLGSAPDRAEGLAFCALDLGWIGATPALEVEVLSDRVVE